MSIYATLYDLGIRRFGDEGYRRIFVQGVPAHINYVGPAWDWLPPPVNEPAGEEKLTFRAVVIVEEGTLKGTSRCAQEYQDALLILNQDEWLNAGFDGLLQQIQAALSERYGGTARAILIDKNGHPHRFYSHGTE
jgi:hypothetical protein